MFLQSKLLKIYESFEEDLKNSTKTLQKRIGRRTYKPEIPSSKEIYKELILPKINVDGFSLLKNSSFSDSLPAYAILFQITFKLKKPYLSKDDDNYYIIDNPIVKDKVFKVPMVRPTTWKGALRFAAVKVFEEEFGSSKADKEEIFKKRARIVKLFGNEKDSLENYLGKLCLHTIEGEPPAEKDLNKKVKEINKEFEEWLVKNGYISKDVPSRAGRLFFYPTFFDRISLDIITPLDRKTRTPVRGRGPIYFEVVPEGTGIFRVLYYPFDLIAKGEFDSIEKELKEDLEFISKAIMKMLTETGFSAKKTSGFGVAEIEEAAIVVGSGLKHYDEDEIKEKVAGGLGIPEEKVRVIPNERQ